ncbi:MAG: glutathione peroxidase [bacterium]
MSNIYDFVVKDNNSNDVQLSEFKDQVLLIVNTASKCGFTPQYMGLQSIYDQYKAQGFTVLGFPCNQFGQQEPGSNEEISSFCEMNFGVTFPLFSKIDVNGKNADPLFVYLKDQARGLLGSQKIKWNFTKFLVNKKGEVVKRFSSQAIPESLQKEIEILL